MQIRLLFIIGSFLFSGLLCRGEEVKVKGDLICWHKVVLEINGPETSEWARENPFLDYRLDVTFSRGDHSFVVPGFYAADGNAAESSAERGNIWLVRFSPDDPGEWQYSVSFRKGKDVAIREGEFEGEPVAPDGVKGSFIVMPANPEGSDFLAKGRIINGGKGYLQHAGTGELWIKNGTDSPENFLAYAGFDQTLRYSLKTEVREGEADPKKELHRYDPHVSDWKPGDPQWQNGKGKGIIGALNYLHSAGVNSVYMLTLNILGDGKDVWPYSDHNERYRFDCSKLDQWEIVFDHMDRLGMMIHFVLQETENECLLDIGFTDVQRKLYLRELTARFAHHQGVTWNLGEENGPAGFSPIGQTDAQKKDMATFLKKINPYPSLVVVHTHANDSLQEAYLTPLLNFAHLDGPSMQVGNPARVNARISRWAAGSRESGKRWIVNLDEIGPHWKGVMPDSHDLFHDTVRAQCLWGALLAGAAGVEWYFGYRYPHTDLTCEDFRSRDQWWKQSKIATGFIRNFPLETMQPANQRISAKNGWCLEKPGETYLIYLPSGSDKVRFELPDDKTRSIRWFNPGTGDPLTESDLKSVSGKGWQWIGSPPDDPDKDWVVVIQ